MAVSQIKMIFSRYSYHSLQTDEKQEDDRSTGCITHRISHLCKNIAFLFLTAISLLWTIYFLANTGGHKLGEISTSKFREHQQTNPFAKLKKK
jgi:hypothetical protein